MEDSLIMKNEDISEIPGEQFLGCVAATGMSRTLGSFKNSFYLQTGGPTGYGINFTDKRLIGVSYSRIASKAYRPAFVLFLIWIAALIALLLFARLTGAQDLPPLPFVMGLVFVDLALLVYWSPRQASKRVELEGGITSLEQLRKLVPDVIVDRTEVSRVSFRPNVITITTKSGESHTFLAKVGKASGYQLLSLFREFCSLIPLIEMTVSDSSGKNGQKIVGRTE